MKILFAGTPHIAIPSLKILAENFNVVGVLTAPDKVTGRGRHKSAPPIKTAALAMDLSILQPAKLNANARKQIVALEPELLVVFAYGRIFGPKFLNLFPKGGINMHPSALPRHRGPSPITTAILSGETESALTVQRIGLEMDAGDILRQTPIRLAEQETTETLSLRVAEEAPKELKIVITELQSNHLTGYPQKHSEASYCSIITKNDGRIDWNQSAQHIERMIRAYQPWPKAWTKMAGNILILLKAQAFSHNTESQNVQKPGTVLGMDKDRGILIQTGEGILGLTVLQAATKKPAHFLSFLNGNPLVKGDTLGEDL